VTCGPTVCLFQVTDRSAPAFVTFLPLPYTRTSHSTLVITQKLSGAIFLFYFIARISKLSVRPPPSRAELIVSTLEALERFVVRERARSRRLAYVETTQRGVGSL